MGWVSLQCARSAHAVRTQCKTFAIVQCHLFQDWYLLVFVCSFGYCLLGLTSINILDVSVSHC